MICRQLWGRRLFWLLLASLCALASSSSSEGDSPPKKVATDEIIAMCEGLIEDTCGILPGSLNFAYRPEAAEGLNKAKLCSGICKDTVEGINCKGTEYEELEGMFGPLGEACRTLTCFDTIKGPCDMTEERSDTPGLPLASCTDSCVSAIESEVCETSDDLRDAIADECEWLGCLGELEPACGPIDFVDSFGMDFDDPIVHSFLMQRAEQLCSSACKDAFEKALGSARVPGDCQEYDQLQEARGYLDKIVCDCYLPAKQECGNGYDLWFGSPDSTDLFAAQSPPCCTEMANLACRMPPSFSFGDTFEQTSQSVPEFGNGSDDNATDTILNADTSLEAPPGPTEPKEDTQAVVGSNSGPASEDLNSQSFFEMHYGQNTKYDASGVAYFESSDPIAQRIIKLHDGCFPSEALGRAAATSGAPAGARLLPLPALVSLAAVLYCLGAELI